MNRTLSSEEIKKVTRKDIPGPPEYYSVKDIQNLFCMSRGTVLGLIYNGSMKGEQMAGKWYISGENLKAYIAQKKATFKKQRDM